MKTKSIQKNIHNKTKKRILLKQQQGWIHITISGEPFERGYQHGHLLAGHFKRIKKVLTFIVKKYFKTSLNEYIQTCKKLITPNIKKYYPEFLEEIHGISKGAKVSVDFLIAWNSLLSMYSYYANLDMPEGHRCSAFIACGDATKDGKIVMAHNTHSDYATGPLANIVMRINPAKGHSFVMQTFAGFIASGTDWFLCDTGIIGCETTISGTNYEPKFGTPYFCRIRQAMQYGESLDDYAQIMVENNAGDYACSWLFGDVNKNQIMLCEIGLNITNIQTTTDGVFYGMNSAMDFELRTMETNDKTFYNLGDSSGARNARLDALLNDKYYGEIDLEIAKRVISDHYDVNTNKNEPNSLSICKHTNLDSKSSTRHPFYPWGCVDGKVTDSNMAKNMTFLGRQGASCGISFNAKKYLKEHPKYANWESVLVDMPTYEWTKL